MKHCRIQILGRVQGVAFRYYTRMKANELGLEGTVENKMDGSVEVFVLGDETKVDQLVEWCHEGSPASKVEAVYFSELEDAERAEYEEFSILR